MSWESGTFSFSNTLNVSRQQPLDARQVAKNLGNLTSNEMTSKFKGMIVSVTNDEDRSGGSADNNGLYILTGTDSTQLSSWTKVGTDVVDTDNIANAAVTEAKIAPNAVTNSRMADNSVSTAEITDSCISTAKLQNDCITADKIGDLGNKVVFKQAFNHSGTNINHYMELNEVNTGSNNNNNFVGKIDTFGLADQAGQTPFVEGLWLAPRTDWTGTATNNHKVRIGGNSVYTAGKLIAVQPIDNNQVTDNTINGSKITDSTITTSKLNFTPLSSNSAVTLNVNPLTINTGDGDKILLTNQSTGTRISHAQGYELQIKAGTIDNNLGKLTIFTGGNTGYQERMRIENTGNVLIGSTSETFPSRLKVEGGNIMIKQTGKAQTTSPAYGTTDANTSIAGLIMVTNTNQYQQGLWFVQNNGVHLCGISGARTDATLWGTHLAFYTDNNYSGADTDPKNTHERMRITQNGNVGIGVTDPDEKLEVNGVLKFSTLDADKIIFTSGVGLTNAQHPRITHGLGWFLQFRAGPSNSNNGQIRFFTGQTTGWSERMRIINNGNVGINTSSPDEKLHVSGSIKVQGALKIFTGDGDKILLTNATTGSRISHAAGWNLRIQAGTYNGNNGQLSLWTGTSAGYAQRVLMNQKGEFMINTSSSGNKKLYVNGAAGGSQNWNASDDRIKYNEEELGDCLSLINQVQTYKYDKILETPKDASHNDVSGIWIPDDASFNDVSHNYVVGKEIGVIAQQLRTISGLEDLVSGEEMDISGNQTLLDVNYNGLLTICIKAIQQLSQEVEYLKSR